MKYLLSILGFFLLMNPAFAQSDQDKYVLLVSFDGFRHDYAEQYQLPTFLDMAMKGTSAIMLPSYPSKTFPNHYTLVTGLYPGNHKLVDNSFYDPELEMLYRVSNRDVVENPIFYGGWPIWQWAQHNGLKSASYFWVGSETKIKGAYPDRWKKYDHDFPNQQRIDSVFSWFAAPKDQRPNIVTLYFALVDDAGHMWGPDDPNMERPLLMADSLLASIRNKIQGSKLPINLVVVSDHGMYRMPRGTSTFIDIASFVDIPKDAVRISNSGTHMHVYLKDKNFGWEFYDKLSSASPKFTIYKRKDIPDHWHYRDSPRVGDFLLVANPGYAFSRVGLPHDWGTHGFDPYATPEMGSIFYAEGPQIKENFRLPEFQNVDVYSLLCELLGLESPETDGDLTIIGKALK